MVSCEKEPGEGGTSTITGKIYVLNYNSEGEFRGEYWAQEERVYIMYGDNPIYDDDTRTNFDGTYQFKYLFPGKYTIFAYSNCTCPADTEPLFETVEIKKRGEEVVVPTITIIN